MNSNQLSTDTFVWFAVLAEWDEYKSGFVHLGFSCVHPRHLCVIHCKMYRHFCVKTVKNTDTFAWFWTIYLVLDAV